jgi:hypothetical protein
MKSRSRKKYNAQRRLERSLHRMAFALLLDMEIERLERFVKWMEDLERIAKLPLRKKGGKYVMPIKLQMEHGYTFARK